MTLHGIRFAVAGLLCLFAGLCGTVALVRMQESTVEPMDEAETRMVAAGTDIWGEARWSDWCIDFRLAQRLAESLVNEPPHEVMRAGSDAFEDGLAKAPAGARVAIIRVGWPLRWEEVSWTATREDESFPPHVDGVDMKQAVLNAIQRRHEGHTLVRPLNLLVDGVLLALLPGILCWSKLRRARPGAPGSPPG